MPIGSNNAGPIPAFTPRGPGHQFVLYGDSCAGIAGHLHSENLRRVNDVVMRLGPSPEFIIYPGDEVIGLTDSEEQLRAQWLHWWDVEMAGPRSLSVPIYNCPANHTVYDAMSERVYREMCPHLPQNGPDDQRGLSYFVRQDELLLVIVNTMWTGLGGEGHLETDWLEWVLKDNADARWKFVIGHHPAFPVNGYTGDYQRTIGSEYRDGFWRLLVEHRVFAYLCSHILAFDTQVHQGVLQITTAGAGTAYRMPQDVEYLHCVQACIDGDGLRYQVLDDEGMCRERLQWPPPIPSSDSWSALDPNRVSTADPVHAFRFSGNLGQAKTARRQTMLSMTPRDGGLDGLWIGLQGKEALLTVIMAPWRGNSPHVWIGPAFNAARDFDVQLALHNGMGPGGVLWRAGDGDPWSTMAGASPWGSERLDWSGRWTVGHAGQSDRMPFVGQDLHVRAFSGPSGV